MCIETSMLMGCTNYGPLRKILGVWKPADSRARLRGGKNGLIGYLHASFSLAGVGCKAPWGQARKQRPNRPFLLS
jgi:hypothetical protein